MNGIVNGFEQILKELPNFVNQHPEIVSKIDEDLFYYLDPPGFEVNKTRLATSIDFPNSSWIVRITRDQNNKPMIVSWINAKCFRLNSEQIPVNDFIYNVLFNNYLNIGFVPGAIEYSFVAIIINEIIKTQIRKEG